MSAAASAARAQAEPGAKAPASRSLHGLDWVNVLMADVQGGVGPYLSVFLAGQRHWSAEPIGLAMAASSIAAALCQIPAGLLVDGSRRKRALIAAAGLLIGLACLLIVACRGVWPVLAAQAMLGAASAVIPPAVAALSLGIVGRRLMPSRISRNESFNHAGSFVAAALAGGFAHTLGDDWIFYLVCVFAVASALAVTLIDPRDIDHDAARGGGDHEAARGGGDHEAARGGGDHEAARGGGDTGGGQPVSIRDLLARRDIVVFLVSVVLFHFGNAAMLPFAGQVLARAHPGSAALALSACIICAQLVMVVVAWAVGRAMRAGIGRKPIYLVALAILPVRGSLFAVTTNPAGVVAIQLLDGVAAGIFGVISVMIASDLTRGTGRFNLMQGVVALAVGAGASLSNVAAGYVVQGFGFAAGFLSLTAVALCALLFFLLLMPETAEHPRPNTAQAR